MESQTIFVKDYSEVGGLQNEYKAKYSILCSEKGSKYGIAIEEVKGENKYCEAESFISNDKKAVEDILRYLYENAVGAQLLHDIIRDCKIKGAI